MCLKLRRYIWEYSKRSVLTLRQWQDLFLKLCFVSLFLKGDQISREWTLPLHWIFFFRFFLIAQCYYIFVTYLRLQNLQESSKSRWDRPFRAFPCLNFNTDNVGTEEARSCVLNVSRITRYCCKLRILAHRLWPHPFLCVFENAHFFWMRVYLHWILKNAD